MFLGILRLGTNQKFEDGGFNFLNLSKSQIFGIIIPCAQAQLGVQ